MHWNRRLKFLNGNVRLQWHSVDHLIWLLSSRNIVVRFVRLIVLRIEQIVTMMIVENRARNYVSVNNTKLWNSFFLHLWIINSVRKSNRCWMSVIEISIARGKMKRKYDHSLVTSIGTSRVTLVVVVVIVVYHSCLDRNKQTNNVDDFVLTREKCTCLWPDLISSLNQRLFFSLIISIFVHNYLWSIYGHSTELISINSH